MDEEFFFPQNVTTTYTLMGLGPRHLRRAAWAGGVGFTAGLFASWQGLPMPVAFLGATVLCAAYGMAHVWPVYAGNLTLWEQWQELRRHKLRQTYFPYRQTETEEVDPLVPAPGGVAALIRSMEPTSGPRGGGPGMA